MNPIIVDDPIRRPPPLWRPIARHRWRSRARFYAACERLWADIRRSETR